LQKLKGRPPLRIDGDQLPIENEVAPERGKRLDDLWEALLSTFSLRENDGYSRIARFFKHQQFAQPTHAYVKFYG
jgi:hypothetical protein